MAGVVERVNSQIYSYTAANKFATFFYALYDDRLQTLTYCNAGHNPPLYFNGGKIRRLSAGGTVVGIFADSKYEEETVHAKTGDVFVAYTDGIIESVNEYGEEFGENRLAQLDPGKPPSGRQCVKGNHRLASSVMDICGRERR